MLGRRVPDQSEWLCRSRPEVLPMQWPLAGGTDRQREAADVRYGSKADIGEGTTDVRFTPNSGYS